MTPILPYRIQGELVVLQQQWLADAMARVISFNSAALVPHGILDHAAVSKIWPSGFKDPVTKKVRVLAPDDTTRRTLLEMIHRFGLALQLQGADGKLQQRSLVPSMLSRSTKGSAIKWRDVTEDHAVMGMTASLDFIPHNLVLQLLLRAYRHAPPGDAAVSIRVAPPCAIDLFKCKSSLTTIASSLRPRAHIPTLRRDGSTWKPPVEGSNVCWAKTREPSKWTPQNAWSRLKCRGLARWGCAGCCGCV